MNRELIKKSLRLWRQFLPLSLSDVTMALGDPAVTMTLANLPRPRENLAAVGTAKSIAVFFESPIIMILHASNTLAANAAASKALKRLTLIAMALLTFLLFVLCAPFIFRFVGERLFHLPDGIRDTTRNVMLPLAIWPAAIAWRRFYQGLLIRAGYAGAVAQAGIGRIMALVGLLAIGYLWAADGARLAGFALAGGVVGEAIFVTLMAMSLGAENASPSRSHKKLPTSLRGVWKFYWPLANSMVVVWGGRAVLLAIIARANDGAFALAVWPAAWGLVVVVSNATRMVQQVIIRNRDEFSDRFLLCFAASVGLPCTLILFAFGHTSIGLAALKLFVGGDAELEVSVIEVVSRCAVLPILIAIQNGVQGILVDEGRTGAINAATYMGTLVLFLVACIGVMIGTAGASIAAVAMICAIVAELAWLIFSLRRMPTALNRPLNPYDSAI